MKTLSKWIMIALISGVSLHCMQAVMGPQRDSGPDAIAQDAGTCPETCTCEIECPPQVKRISISVTVDATSTETVYIDDWDSNDPPMVQLWVRYLSINPDLDSWRTEPIRLHPSGVVELQNDSIVELQYRIIVVK
ncbi:MAG: hypothetical protein KAS32_19380 [Candidatus Peribacteraceae bacterium]|nr:hypothetical protein [Candidatus Peribacteraceae bacterium]